MSYFNNHNYFQTRECGFSKDKQFYIYKKWCPLCKSFVYVKVNALFLSDEIIDSLEFYDSKMRLSNRYAYESPDNSYKREHSDFYDYCNLDVRSIFGSSKSNKYSSMKNKLLFNNSFNKKLNHIYDFVDKKCSKKQQEIFYKHLCLNMTLEQIRKDEISNTGINVSKQAMSNRKRGLIKKLKTYLTSE